MHALIFKTGDAMGGALDTTCSILASTAEASKLEVSKEIHLSVGAFWLRYCRNIWLNQASDMVTG